MRKTRIIFFCLCLFILCASVSLAEDRGTSADSHVERGDRYFLNSQLFMALNEYEQALLKDAGNPDIFRKLSILRYELGFLDESVDDLEKAVALSPRSEELRLDLGVFYLAKGRLDKARDQFISVIEANPGMADAYYYLGEIFFREKNYDMAWLLAKRSVCLGHQGKGLLKKLGGISAAPDSDPCACEGEDLYIRQILVDTKAEAEDVTGRIAEGELFEEVAAGKDRNRDVNPGGYLGRFTAPELHPRIAQALAEHKAFSAPFTVETESGFHVIQRIAPFHINEWKKAGKNKSDKEPYLVFTGAYRKEQNAAEAVNRLKGLGFQSYKYEQTTESKGTVHTVVAGKYESLEKAREAAEDLARRGFEYFISRED